jgi:hypothetical protein
MSWQTLDVPWERRAPDDRIFEVRRRHFLRHGMVATLQAWESDGLVGLSVQPRDEFMKGPPNAGTPWHISVAFEPEPRRLQAFLEAWGRPRQVHLRFSRLGTNAVAALASDDPVARDPLIRAMHDADQWYGHRPLHVTF